MRLGRGLIEQGSGNRQLLGGGRIRLQTLMFGKFLGDQAGAECSTNECRVLQQAGKQALVALHAQQHAVLHRPQQFAPGFFAGSTMGDDLAQHRVIEGADALTFDQAVVESHAFLQTGFPAGNASGLREETLGRVFSI
ncbi:hypothetical protein D3C86_1409560 [compost metagenome]